MTDPNRDLNIDLFTVLPTIDEFDARIASTRARELLGASIFED